MFFLKQNIGMALVVTGALLLIISFFLGWTSSNLILLSALIIIMVGAFLHVWQQKKLDKY